MNRACPTKKNYQLEEGPKGPKLSWDYMSETNVTLPAHTHKVSFPSTDGGMECSQKNKWDSTQHVR